MVWKEAPESAIHSVWKGGVATVMLNVCAILAGAHSPGQVG
jgi:hypothetical protein